MAAPLFEEEGDVMLDAEVSQLANPIGADATVPWARLAASDEPVNAAEVETSAELSVPKDLDYVPDVSR